MSFREYWHERAEESRHNEALAYLMFLAGAIFFVGGIIETLSLLDEPQWFLFIPYHTAPLAGAVLGLALTITGLSLTIFGIVSGLNYSHNRNWYMNELRKANPMEEHKMKKKKTAKENTKKKRKTAKS
jgi:hypothetical protein